MFSVITILFESPENVLFIKIKYCYFIIINA